MLAHFCHPVVFFSYILAVVVSFFLFRLPYSAVIALAAGISIVLMIVDYLVHTLVHNWKLLRFPTATAAWVVVVAAALITGLVTQGWQLVGIFLAQGLWDNSWHARYHHRIQEGPRTELDQPFIRWGVATVAVAVVLIPNLL